MNSTHNIMVLIEALLADGGEIGVRELASRTGVPKSTVQRFLSSIQDNGWVAQDGRTQGYKIGYKLLSMANAWRLRLDLKRLAEEIMRALCEAVNQTVLLFVPDGCGSFCLEKMESEKTIKLAAEVGRAFPLHVGACAKALLSYVPEPLQKHVLYSELESYTPATIAEPKALEAEIDKIRELGYAASAEEMTIGVAEAAVPLLASDGTLIGALGIAGAKADVEPKFEQYAAMLKESAREIMERLENY